MTGCSWMLNRGGTYYFRKAVPNALRPVIGKREVLVSLRTKDREVAKQLERVPADVEARTCDQLTEAFILRQAFSLS